MDKKYDGARTSGDGMENEVVANVDASKMSPAIKVDYNSEKVPKNIRGEAATRRKFYLPEDHVSMSLPAVIPKGKIIHLIPRLKPTEPRRNPNKVRDPKFVPFEPYKAAVNPIIPLKNKNRFKLNKNNLDINVLVSQMASIKVNALSKSSSEKSVEKTELEQEKERYDQELDSLRKERDFCQAQLKLQVQVNAELKSLLIASVGEDLQTRVNVLTEDKLQLARALLDSANNLSSHTEQIEYLAGQCEVWRSKFLASSVMIEELARWKADLTHKNKGLSEANKRLLQLLTQIREMQIDILKNLKFLSNLRSLNLPSSRITDLSAECLNISQQMVLHSGIGIPENLILNNLEILTETEKLAIKALEDTNQPLMATDDAFKAIVSQAFPSLGNTINPYKPPTDNFPGSVPANTNYLAQI